MKSKHKRILSIVMSLILMAGIVASPITGFAKEKNKDKDDDRREHNSSSVTASIFGIANAQTDDDEDEELDDNDSRDNQNASVTQNGNRPPSISGITSPTVLTVGEIGTWTVNASDPENGPLSYAVDWGDIDSSLKSLSARTSFVQTAKFEHAYATPGTYKVRFTVRDDAGKTNSSSVTVRVRASQDAAPIISEPKVDSVKPRQAKIVWKTDKRSDTAVWYSTVSPINTSLAPSIQRVPLVAEHKLTLTGLTPATTYYAVVRSRDRNGNMTMSPEISFVTPALPNANKPPSIVSIMGSTSLMVDEVGTWTVNASDPENGPLSYAVNWGDAGAAMRSLASKPIFVQTAEFEHAYAVPGTYTITFTVRDDAGQTVSSNANVTVSQAADNTAPVISNLSFATSTSTIDVAWSTDEPSMSRVFYGTSTPLDINSDNTPFVDDKSLVTGHSLIVSGLATSTQYYLVVRSSDAAGNIATSSETSVITD